MKIIIVSCLLILAPGTWAVEAESDMPAVKAEMRLFTVEEKVKCVEVASDKATTLHCNWNRDIEQEFYADMLKVREKDTAARLAFYKKERADYAKQREERYAKTMKESDELSEQLRDTQEKARKRYDMLLEKKTITDT